MMNIFESENIIYRLICEEDTDLILSWRNSDLVRKFFIYQPIITKEQHLLYYRDKCETGEVYQFVMINKENNIPFGCVYLKDIDKINKKCEYGIFIGSEKCLNKGLGTEACRTMKEFAFNELNLHKVYLRVIDSNARAIKSYQKAGFHVEGTFEDEVMINDKYVTLFFMAAINQERVLN